RDISALLQLDNTSQPLVSASFAIGEVVAEVVDQHTDRALAKSINLQVKLSNGRDAVLEGDRYRVHQILANLLSNALKYTDAEGSVTVSVGVTDAGLEMSVADTGCGIPAGEMERIWEPFVRVKPVGKPPVEGAGLV